MPQIISRTVEIGADAYGRRVTATRHITYDGKTLWDIVSDPVSQRDEGERMSGLTDENLRQLRQAEELIRRGTFT